MQVSATAARTILSLAPLPDRPTRSAQTILSLAALRDKTILRVLIPSLVTTPAWSNTPGQGNSFFGDSAGSNNITGNGNSFFGAFTGQLNSGGSDNTFLGGQSGGAAGVTNSTAVGTYAMVTQSNSLVLGGINGVNF